MRSPTSPFHVPLLREPYFLSLTSYRLYWNPHWCESASRRSIENPEKCGVPWEYLMNTKGGSCGIKMKEDYCVLKKVISTHITSIVATRKVRFQRTPYGWVVCFFVCEFFEVLEVFFSGKGVVEDDDGGDALLLFMLLTIKDLKLLHETCDVEYKMGINLNWNAGWTLKLYIYILYIYITYQWLFLPTFPPSVIPQAFILWVTWFFIPAL